MLSIFVGLCIFLPTIWAGPIVETPLGRYEGWERSSRAGRLYEAWTKIPYAQPPLGNNQQHPLAMSSYRIFSGLCIFSPTIWAGPVVETPLGRYEGWERLSRAGRLYEAWTKIPYAQPPLGKLRFKAPLPISKHEGVFNATAHITQCLQLTGGAEDCLQLNVFRPKGTSGMLPVLVYVHGGAFIMGKPGTRESADYLMDEDVILVQVAYRLNAFGFLSLGDDVIPGNFGLKDQVMALKWVNQNIASFGGDPSKVTVFGESAGGASTHLLLTTPLTEHLLSQAVSHSGTINHVWGFTKTENAKHIALIFAENVKCLRNTSDEILKCLQGVDANVLEVASMQIPKPKGVLLNFAPVIEPKTVEGAFMTEDLSLRPSKKPWISSCANGEFELFMAAPELTPDGFTNETIPLSDRLGNFIKSLKDDTTFLDESIQALEDVYYADKNETFLLQYSTVIQMFMDASFVYPMIYTIKNHQGPKWMFHMEYKGELSARNKTSGEQYPYPVASHADEILFYFNSRSDFKGVGPDINPADLEVSKRLIKYLVNFAKYGNPTPSGSSLIWPQFQKREMMRVTADGDTMSSESVLPKLVKLSYLWSSVIGWQ